MCGNIWRLRRRVCISVCSLGGRIPELQGEYALYMIGASLPGVKRLGFRVVRIICLQCSVFVPLGNLMAFQAVDVTKNPFSLNQRGRSQTDGKP
jgi:hypothetical protein